MPEFRQLHRLDHGVAARAPDLPADTRRTDGAALLTPKIRAIFDRHTPCVLSDINMRALVLNGALAGDEGLQPMEDAVGSTLATSGWIVDRIELRDVFIAYCKGCFDCWVKTPGLCATRDGAGVVTRALACSDLAVLLSPITFGGYSSELKKALDRSIGIVSPFFARVDGEVHHAARYTRHPALLGIGVSEDRDPEEAQIFARLVGRNAINFHAPAHAVCLVSRDDSPEQMRTAIARALTQVTTRRGAA